MTNPIIKPKAFPKIYAPKRMNMVAGIQKGVEIMYQNMNKGIANHGSSFMKST